MRKNREKIGVAFESETSCKNCCSCVHIFVTEYNFKLLFSIDEYSIFLKLQAIIIYRYIL